MIRGWKRDPSIVDVLAEAGVRHVFTSAGDPALFTARLHDAAMTVVHVVGSLKGARKALDAGVDAGGGRASRRRLQVTAVRLHDGAASVGGRARRPADHRGGRHLRRAVGRGGGGAGRRGRQMGTRMLASREAGVHANFKEAIVAADDSGTVLLDIRQPTMRVLRTGLASRVAADQTASPLLGRSPRSTSTATWRPVWPTPVRCPPASSTSCRSPRSSAAPGRAPGIARGRGPARRTVTGKAAYAKRSVRSRDGTTIGFRQLGAGPASCSCTAARWRHSTPWHEARQRLADAFTVCIPDRRGRGMSGPYGPDYSIEREDEDLAAVVAETGAQCVFGIADGGLFALHGSVAVPRSARSRCSSR